MAEDTGLKKLAVVVGIVAGLIGVYRAFRPVAPQPSAADVAFVKPLSGEIRYGYVQTAAKNIAWFDFTVQNLGKQDDATDVKVHIEHQADLVDYVFTDSQDVIRPGEKATFEIRA